jgi:hypothetical protein
MEGKARQKKEIERECRWNKLVRKFRDRKRRRWKGKRRELERDEKATEGNRRRWTEKRGEREEIGRL